ncbi:hypothetical protein PV08_09766 [Exophiala spinifera]|uniref:Ribonuclease H2 subunit B n=1 Tax=Exophiala spinifera TaxID=91928 RepID=A0A0D2BMZ2_9EURO|nr:uncharacterized protein PV08_09766 [Exophiala spinifera]KIW12489.1 hypothetical protein PV08_09766 [Exophiala spinifera]
MVVTRSATSSPVKKSVGKGNTDVAGQPEESLRHFVLPNDVSERARFVLLRHPRNGNVERFLFCPKRGLFQFTKVDTPRSDPRSLFVHAPPSATTSKGEDDVVDEDPTDPRRDGSISKSAEIFVATPFDLAFLLIPLVIPSKPPTGKHLFQPADDIFEQHIEDDRHLRYILENGRDHVQEAMARFCDTIEAGDEQMYRPNEDKTLGMVMEKVKSAIEHRLPASLEEKFVARALETPVLSVKRENTQTSTKSESISLDDTESVSDNLDSQSTTASTAPSAVFSEVSMSTSSITEVSAAVPQTLLDLRKQRVVLDFILASYIPEAIAHRLKAKFACKDSPVDFKPLEEHMKSLAALRADALASRSLGDFSRKRGLDDDEAADMRAEKKRKQDEEEKKRKMGESRGVWDLKKVNVTGMKKMSDFFTKKPAGKAKG